MHEPATCVAVRRIKGPLPRHGVGPIVRAERERTVDGAAGIHHVDFGRSSDVIQNGVLVVILVLVPAEGPPASIGNGHHHLGARYGHIDRSRRAGAVAHGAVVEPDLVRAIVLAILAQVDVQYVAVIVVADDGDAVAVSLHLRGGRAHHLGTCKRDGLVGVVLLEPVPADGVGSGAYHHDDGHGRGKPRQRMQAAGTPAHASKDDDDHAHQQAESTGNQRRHLQLVRNDVLTGLGTVERVIPVQSGDREQCEAEGHKHQEGPGRLPAPVSRLRFDRGGWRGESRRHVGRGERGRPVHRLLRHMGLRRDVTRTARRPLPIDGIVRRDSLLLRHATLIPRRNRLRSVHCRHERWGLRWHRPGGTLRAENVRIVRYRTILRLLLPSRRIGLPIYYQPQYECRHRKGHPARPGQADGDRHAHEHADAAPIPVACDQFLAQDTVVGLIRQQEPGHAVEGGAASEEQRGENHQRTHQRHIPTKTTGKPIADTADPTVAPSLQLTFSNPCEEPVGRGGLRLACRPLRRVPLVASRIMVYIAHGSITPTRDCHTYRGTP